MELLGSFCSFFSVVVASASSGYQQWPLHCSVLSILSLELIYIFIYVKRERERGYTPESAVRTSSF